MFIDVTKLHNIEIVMVNEIIQYIKYYSICENGFTNKISF